MQNPIILLDKPQLGDNIGMAARAMMNCGLDELRIINPRDGWPNQKAFDAAVGAHPIITNAKCYDTLAEATADLVKVYATTGRVRGIELEALTPNQAMPRIYNEIFHAKQKTGILFGQERSGLGNDELAHANAILYFPLNPEFKSLNLSHAVMLVAWEWLRITQENNQRNDHEWVWKQQGETIAERGEFENLFNRIMEGAEAGGFFHNDKLRPVVERNLRLLLTRARMSEQEIRTLHGVVRALRSAPPLKKPND